jgi:hypothetical protein
MNAADVIPALEQVAGVLANSAATSGEFAVAAELSLAAVSALDDALAGHQASKAEIFSAIAPPVAAPGKYRLRARSIVETVEAILAHGRDGKILSTRREIAVWLAAQLDARAGDAAKAESARDEVRKPFAAETKRGNLSQRRRSEPMSSRSDLQNIPLWPHALLPCFGLTYSSRDSARAPTAGCRCGDRMSVSSEQFVYRECSLRRSA